HRLPALRQRAGDARRGDRVLAPRRGRRRRGRRLMEVRVWGCRGSLATPGADTVRYGGNTSCVAVRTESGHLLVLDAGTGIRPLGATIDPAQEQEIHI